MKHFIELSCDHADADGFVAWLTERGHEASVGATTGNYVDGEWTSSSPEASEILRELWGAYCAE